MSARLQGAAVRAFVLAGNATFTIRSVASGARFTFKVRASDDSRVHFVKVLVGSDNTHDYAYLGYIRQGEYRHGAAKARVGADAPSAKAFAWFWQNVSRLVGCEVFHEGHCGRCGRALTVPESIESGIGPECAGRMSEGAPARRGRRVTPRAGHIPNRGGMLQRVVVTDVRKVDDEERAATERALRVQAEDLAERAARIEAEEVEREERKMQLMEAEGDREQTLREETARWESDLFRDWSAERAANAGAAQ